jgi:hypothetical protein
VLFYGVVSDSLQEAVELFPSREEAEAIVIAGAIGPENKEAVSTG